jgi:hypothetical protein
MISLIFSFENNWGNILISNSGKGPRNSKASISSTSFSKTKFDIVHYEMHEQISSISP